jgi:hypothetical protein
MKDNRWLRLLAFVTGMVNQQLLLQNEYLAAENRILRTHLPKRLRLSDAERSTLAEIGKRLGRKALSQVACVAKPETILVWYRRLIAEKFRGSKHRNYLGRPSVKKGMRPDSFQRTFAFCSNPGLPSILARMFALIRRRQRSSHGLLSGFIVSNSRMAGLDRVWPIYTPRLSFSRSTSRQPSGPLRLKY